MKKRYHSKDEAKDQYDRLLEEGVLLEMFPFLTGDWTEDKEFFIESYNFNKKAIKDGGR